MLAGTPWQRRPLAGDDTLHTLNTNAMVDRGLAQVGGLCGSYWDRRQNEDAREAVRINRAPGEGEHPYQSYGLLLAPSESWATEVGATGRSEAYKLPQDVEAASAQGDALAPLPSDTFAQCGDTKGTTSMHYKLMFKSMMQVCSNAIKHKWVGSYSLLSTLMGAGLHHELRYLFGHAMSYRSHRDTDFHNIVEASNMDQALQDWPGRGDHRPSQYFEEWAVRWEHQKDLNPRAVALRRTTEGHYFAALLYPHASIHELYHRGDRHIIPVPVYINLRPSGDYELFHPVWNSTSAGSVEAWVGYTKAVLPTANALMELCFFLC